MIQPKPPYLIAEISIESNRVDGHKQARLLNFYNYTKLPVTRWDDGMLLICVIIITVAFNYFLISSKNVSIFQFFKFLG